MVDELDITLEEELEELERLEVLSLIERCRTAEAGVGMLVGIILFSQLLSMHIEYQKISDATCTDCGHDQDYHGAGMLGGWCDATCTWHTEMAQRHPELLCQCTGFKN